MKKTKKIVSTILGLLSTFSFKSSAMDFDIDDDDEEFAYDIKGNCKAYSENGDSMGVYLSIGKLIFFVLLMKIGYDKLKSYGSSQIPINPIVEGFGKVLIETLKEEAELIKNKETFSELQKVCDTIFFNDVFTSYFAANYLTIMLLDGEIENIHDEDKKDILIGSIKKKMWQGAIFHKLSSINETKNYAGYCIMECCALLKTAFELRLVNNNNNNNERIRFMCNKSGNELLKEAYLYVKNYVNQNCADSLQKKRVASALGRDSMKFYYGIDEIEYGKILEATMELTN